jgi:outer membrane protein assembly factor BamB
MCRRFFPLAFAVVMAALGAAGNSLSAASELISETVAAQHGLTRPWFAQVGVDSGQGQLRDLILYKDALYAQTDKAVVHAIDAETGRTLWCKQVGQPKYPSMPPDANRDLLAVVNGSRLYVLNRFNGDLLYQREIEDAPDAGPVLSAKRVYIPMSNGRLIAYRLDPQSESKKEEGQKSKKSPTPEEKSQLDAERRQNLRLSQQLVPPAFCQSFGQALVQPLMVRENANEESVVWPTDRGYLNVGSVNRRAEDSLTLKFRVETGTAVAGRPAYLPPDPKVPSDSGLIIAVSRDGYVHAIQEKNGEYLWRFPTGEAVVASPAVIGNHVYVSTQLGGMYCLEVKSGKNLWFAPNVVQFVAASKTRVYAADNIGRLVVLNADNGVTLDAMATEKTFLRLHNASNDRIYLADTAGLIQCLHEVEQSEPIVHDKDRKEAAEAEEQAAEPKEVTEKEKPAKKEPAKKEPAKKERAAPKERPAPKERATPKERPAPKERPLPKDRVKKALSKKAGAAAGADANPFNQPAGDAGKDNKAKGAANPF